MQKVCLFLIIFFKIHACHIRLELPVKTSYLTECDSTGGKAFEGGGPPSAELKLAKCITCKPI